MAISAMAAMQAGLALFVVVLVSALLTRAALAYARRRALLDGPGRRRSHAGVTPRGGGVAPVSTWILSVLLLGLWSTSAPPALWWLLLSSFLVATVSWIDDHRSLPVLPRLAVHSAAAVLLVLGVMGPGMDMLEWAQRLLLVIALVLSTNFWNFMDGIDGMAVMQSIVVALSLSLYAMAAGAGLPMLLALLLAAAVSGFVPFNFPEARIFLGDVGSTTLGFALAGIAVLGFADGAWGWSLWPVVASVFLIDAGLTLLSRLLRGSRWYTPHREHLYQWLHRSGLSHPRVVAMYLACNLLLVAPFVLLLRLYPSWGAGLWATLWVLLSALWLWARRLLLRRARGTQAE